MSPSLAPPLDYVGHGFKRFSPNPVTWGSAGVCGACCHICCPSGAETIWLRPVIAQAPITSRRLKAVSAAAIAAPPIQSSPPRHRPWRTGREPGRCAERGRDQAPTAAPPAEHLQVPADLANRAGGDLWLPRTQRHRQDDHHSATTGPPPREHRPRRNIRHRCLGEPHTCASPLAYVAGEPFLWPAPTSAIPDSLTGRKLPRPGARSARSCRAQF